MKVICRERDPLRLVEEDKEYIVFGIMVGKNSEELNYLVSYLGGWPDWVSSKYFDIVDNDILPDWHIKTHIKKNGLHNLFCLSGFNELCNNEDYFDALIGGKKWALDIYSKKHEEAVEWYKCKPSMEPFMMKKVSLW